MAVAELATTSSVLQFQQQLEDRGAYVVVAASPTSLDGRRCEALGAVGGLLGAGSITSAGIQSAAAAPTVEFEVGLVTPGLLHLWFGSHAFGSPRWLVGPDLTTEIAAGPSSWLLVGNEVLELDAVIASRPMADRADRWLVQVVTAGPATECWIEFPPFADGIADDYVRAVFASSGGGVLVGRLVRLDELTRDHKAELASRPLRAGWIGAGAVICLLLWMAGWFRRSEYSLYLATGTKRSELWLMSQLEDCVLLSLGGVAGFLWASAFVQADAGRLIGVDELQIAARNVGSAILVAMIFAPMRVLFQSRHTMIDALKDR